ncbi:hypothetical protein BC937DRAFT_86408 [Endogone sp. FLAS-F59071]|nr:hypothetical protein BC937DRAFT_86408 [Endogone sp. FLAS-F59071]|eukprot:RUS13065.1 hypothetical protein BC937DRAFT_86408 [Endogone sp. FLAS-F59071]
MTSHLLAQARPISLPTLRSIAITNDPFSSPTPLCLYWNLLVVTSSISAAPAFLLSAFAATNTKLPLGATWTFLTDVQLHLSMLPRTDEEEGTRTTGRWCTFRLVRFVVDAEGVSDGISSKKTKLVVADHNHLPRPRALTLDTIVTSRCAVSVLAGGSDEVFIGGWVGR